MSSKINIDDTQNTKPCYNAGMILLKESNLRDLLNRRKKFIKTHVGFIEALISFIVYAVSLVIADIFHAELPVKIVVSILTFMYIILTIFAFKDSHYSADKLYQDIVSTSESKKHNFSLIIIRDKKNKYGKYLLQYNKRWKCYLFPFLRTMENGDVDSVKDFLEYELKAENYAIDSTKEDDFTKVSVSANLTKTYHHIFYPVDLDVLNTKLNTDKTIIINGNKFKWFSIEEMKADENILSKNSETIEYVESNF